MYDSYLSLPLEADPWGQHSVTYPLTHWLVIVSYTVLDKKSYLTYWPDGFATCIKSCICPNGFRQQKTYLPWHIETIVTINILIQCHPCLKRMNIANIFVTKVEYRKIWKWLFVAQFIIVLLILSAPENASQINHQVVPPTTPENAAYSQTETYFCRNILPNI